MTKPGRLRGNASGRTYDWRYRKFFCDGCQRQHGRYVDRTQMLDGALLCNRQYYARLERERRKAA